MRLQHANEHRRTRCALIEITVILDSLKWILTNLTSYSLKTVMKIEGAVAIVTGGASGIGKAICEKLLQGGAKVSKPFKTTVEKPTRKYPRFHTVRDFYRSRFMQLSSIRVQVRWRRVLYIIDIFLRFVGESITNYRSWRCDYKSTQKITLRFIDSATKVFIIKWQSVAITANIGFLFGKLIHWNVKNSKVWKCTCCAWLAVQRTKNFAYVLRARVRSLSGV